MKDSSFKPFGSDEQKSAWLYLIDTSNPKRQSIVTRNAELVAGQVRNSNDRRLVGVASFSSGMEMILPIAAVHNNTDARLSSIKATGVTTEFFAASLEAVKRLASVQADRKALVIFSDGEAEDTAYSREDVVKAARDAGVIIIGLGYADAESTNLQQVRRLAEETNGAYQSVIGSERLPDEFVANLNRYLENGGTVVANLEDQSGDVDINLALTMPDGNTVSASQTVSVAALPAEIEPEPDTFIGNIYKIFSFISPGASKWANANSIMATLLLSIPLLLIGGILAAVSMRKKDEIFETDFMDEEPVTGLIDDSFAENPELATRAISAGGVGAFGYFEIVGNEATKYQIQSYSVSIGRHSDNDFQLSNDSVHRHHAHVHVSPEGQPTIHDLDTTNGIYVNSQKVASAQLKAGDLIEMGEVRLRYQTS
ncbi:MAG: FHA domain-containing protein [Salaquimonas sp.]